MYIYCRKWPSRIGLTGNETKFLVITGNFVVPLRFPWHGIFEWTIGIPVILVLLFSLHKVTWWCCKPQNISEFNITFNSHYHSGHHRPILSPSPICIFIYHKYVCIYVYMYTCVSIYVHICTQPNKHTKPTTSLFFTQNFRGVLPLPQWDLYWFYSITL